MRILAIDTALGACSACVLADGDDGGLGQELLAHESVEMERGQAEALLPMIDRVVSGVEGGFESLHRVAVTVGPGSYTGLRVGIAAARAIGLATGVPVTGVTTLSALLAAVVSTGSRRVLAAAIDARHGAIYFQAIAPGGRSLVAPSVMSVRDAVRVIGSGPALLIGSGAPSLAAEAWAVGLDAAIHDASPAPDIIWVARLGLVAEPGQALPKPLYLKPVDARPQDAAAGLPRR